LAFGPKLTLALVVGTVAVLGLSACGRKGPLELPPGPATGEPAASSVPPTSPSAFLPSMSAAGPGSPDDPNGVKTGFDAHGNPVASPGQKKSFILDPLLQ
jgi:predicted small lipoprotein YifL